MVGDAGSAAALPLRLVGLPPPLLGAGAAAAALLLPPPVLRSCTTHFSTSFVRKKYFWGSSGNAT